MDMYLEIAGIKGGECSTGWSIPKKMHYVHIMLALALFGSNFILLLLKNIFSMFQFNNVKVISLTSLLLLISADEDVEFSFPHEWFRFGLIPAGSTDAIVIW